MKTVEITEAHYGYPDGHKKRFFGLGETPELPNQYAELIIGKGQAKEVAPAPVSKNKEQS